MSKPAVLTLPMPTKDDFEKARGKKNGVHREVVQLMNHALVDLDRNLGETVNALETGELDIADLSWEDELAPHEPNGGPPR